MTKCAFDLMTWSYSRLSAYLACPYRFYTRYVDACEESPMFYSEYGSLIHSVLAGLHRGEITQSEAVNKFLIGFASDVPVRGASYEIRGKFFRQGLSMLSEDSWKLCGADVMDVEREVFFDVEGIPFTGFVDLITRQQDGSIRIVDHKSHALKPRSARKKPTQSDRELDEYLRQLYLYSIPVKELCGEYPSTLSFFCYRDGVWIDEPFSMRAFDDTVAWAADTVREIRRTESWDPCIDTFRCRSLCGFSDICEYIDLNGDNRKGRRSF